MTVRVYKSSDASAPSLTNAAGTLIAVLDACLVNGYGSKTAAGWTKAYSGTNLAAYKQGGTTYKHSHYLRVDDTASTASNARVVGYETMSDINTGTNPFPADLQMSGGLYLYKTALSSPNRPWMIVATERTFYLWIVTSDNTLSGATILNSPIPSTSSSQPVIYMFGDFISYDASETHSCILIANSNSNSNSNYFGAFDYYASGASAIGNIMTTHYLSQPSRTTKMLSPDLLNTSSKVTKVANQWNANNAVSGQTIINSLHSTQNKWFITKPYIVEYVIPITQTSSYNVINIRGELPGLYFTPTVPTGFEDSHTITFSGKTLTYKSIRQNPNSWDGGVFIETSDTW